MTVGGVSGALSTRQRPSSAWALALLLLGGGLRCFVGPGAHTVSGNPSALVTTVGALSVLFGGLVYLLGDRCPRVAIPVLLAGTITVTSVLVATADNRADVALGALAYPWAGLYAALFLSRRAGYAVIALIAGGFAAAIVATGLPGLLGAWVIVNAMVVAVTAITGSLVAALRRQSETDPLTGVANRAGFQRLADQLLASASRRGESVALLLCDIDGLKQVNDAGGHAAGDAVLTGVVREWLGVLRSNDVIARLGGDEFAVLLPDTDDGGAVASVERLRAATTNAFSAGVAVWAPGTTLDELLAAADAAMYACKPTRARLGVRARARATPPGEPRRRIDVLSSGNLLGGPAGRLRCDDGRGSRGRGRRRAP